MRALPTPGLAVNVVWRQETSPHSSRGRLRRITGEAVAVELDTEQGFPWEGGAEVLLVVGEIGARQVAKARFVMARERLAVFTLVTRFRPFDLRSQRRYPLDARTEVHSVFSQTRQRGQVLDISLGGLAVAVGSRPTGKRVEVPLQLDGFSATLPCEIVGSAERRNGVVLHLKFAGLTPAQGAFVRCVVERLQHEMELAQAS